MQIDTGTLREIREWRAMNDPLIPHPRRQAWLETIAEDYHEDVVEARLERLDTAPSSEPVQKATWIETTIFCFTRSMDSAIDHEKHLGAYQYTMEQMAAEDLPNAPDSLLPDSMEIITTEQHRELAESFREYIATAQHTVFIESAYDDAPIDTDGVPKAFWRKSAPATNNDGKAPSSDENDAQISLTDY